MNEVGVEQCFTHVCIVDNQGFIYRQSQSQPSYSVLVNFHQILCDEIMLRPQKKKKKKKKTTNNSKIKNKKTPCFTGRRTC